MLFIEWLVDLEDKGFKVFGENYSRIKERLRHDEGKNDNQSRISQQDADLFFINKRSHQEGTETQKVARMKKSWRWRNAFMVAAHSMKVMGKRKDCGTEAHRNSDEVYEVQG